MTARAPVTLSSENGRIRFRPSLELCQAANVGQRPAHAPQRPIWELIGPRLLKLKKGGP